MKQGISQKDPRDAGRRAARARKAGKVLAKKHYGLRPFGSFRTHEQIQERKQQNGTTVQL